MNKEQESNEDVFPAIYDFSLLPFALGDILTWNMKACIRAVDAGIKRIDIHLCADEEAPANVSQGVHIKPENYEWHLFELLPAFSTNPMLRNIHIYRDRVTFGNMLRGLSRKNNGVRKYLEEYEAAFGENYSSHGAEKALFDMCSSHADINEFYAKNKYIPKLVAPAGCRQDILGLRRGLGVDTVVVALNFRTRDHDRTAVNSENDRNVNFQAWFEFIKLVERKFPNVKFLLLGKVQEKPLMLLRMNNVIVPRLLGCTLGHELAILALSDFFMGSSSGFSEMVGFTDVPYVVTKLGKRACEVFGINMGDPHLPFGRPDQILVYDKEETSTMLFAHFAALYRHRKRNPHYEKYLADIEKKTKENEKKQKEIEAKTAILFNSPEAALEDIRGYVHRALLRANKLIEAEDFTTALSILENVLKEYPEEAREKPHFHSLRALCLIKMDRLNEAEEAVVEELVNQPLGYDVLTLRAHIGRLMRQKGIKSTLSKAKDEQETPPKPRPSKKAVKAKK